MKKLLIVTKLIDLSIPFFLTQKIRHKIDIDFCFYHESMDEIKERLTSCHYDYIYIRDPFHFTSEKSEFEEKIRFILKHCKDSYMIDSIQDLEDIYFEDKWAQYQIFSAFMPKTQILKDAKELNDRKIIKKRISSRSKGIVFDAKDLSGKDVSEYIIQDKINIEKELRIYVIFDEIIKTASIKTSKTEESKVHVTATETLSPELENFVQEIIKKTKFDFMGLDIVKEKNELYLLEVNRSCFFTGFFRETSMNLAEVFIDKLLKK